MTVLRVVAEPLIGRVDDTQGEETAATGAAMRSEEEIYAAELIAALIDSAPPGCSVDAMVAAHSAAEVAELRRMLPGLAEVRQAPVRRRELMNAWRLGLPVASFEGMLHSPTLLAPLTRHSGELSPRQSVVTVHDTAAFDGTAPAPRDAAWQKAMLKRAARYADAVVVPSHAVATRLLERHRFGDRLRVIGAAPRSTLEIPADAEARASALALPEHYVLAAGSLEARTGVRALIHAMAEEPARAVPLLIIGPHSLGNESVAGVASAAGLPEGRVRTLESPSDADEAVLYGRADVYVDAALGSGFGRRIVEAFRLSAPVVHSDDEALSEAAADAGLSVPRADAEGYPLRLAEAIGRVLDDTAMAERMRVAGRDRAGAFTWRDAAERVWQLHADL